MKTVSDTFENLKIGSVKRVDFVHKRNTGGEYNAVYIHFNYWYDNIAARNFQERVLDVNREARIVYDEPWYWIVLENKGAKAVSNKRKPRIDIEALTKTGDVAPVEKMMTNQDFANLFKNEHLESSLNEDLESSLNEDLESSLNEDLESSLNEDFKKNDIDFDAFVRLMTSASKETYYAKEEAAFITHDDLFEENRKLREQLGEYIEKVGRLEHEFNMLMDEKICVNNELAWLKEQQVYNNV